MPPKKTVTPAKKPATSIVKWEEELAKHATKAVASERTDAGGSNSIGLRAGMMTFKGEKVPGSKMNVVITASIMHNQYYGNAEYDADNPASPVCYAYGDDKDTMAPHPASPNKQHETCSGCPQNEYGTANTGKGKACKNGRKLTLITEAGADSNPVTAEGAVLKLPPTSVKGFQKYVEDLAEVEKRPPFAVVTEVSVQPDAKTQLSVTFKLIRTIDDGDVIEGLFKRHDKDESTIVTVYPVNAEKAAPPPKKGPGKFAKPAPVKGRR